MEEDMEDSPKASLKLKAFVSHWCSTTKLLYCGRVLSDCDCLSFSSAGRDGVIGQCEVPKDPGYPDCASKVDVSWQRFFEKLSHSFCLSVFFHGCLREKYVFGSKHWHPTNGFLCRVFSHLFHWLMRLFFRWCLSSNVVYPCTVCPHPRLCKTVSLLVIGHKKSRVHLQKQKLVAILQLV